MFEAWVNPLRTAYRVTSFDRLRILGTLLGNVQYSVSYRVAPADALLLSGHIEQLVTYTTIRPVKPLTSWLLLPVMRSELSTSLETRVMVHLQIRMWYAFSRSTSGLDRTGYPAALTVLSNDSHLGIIDSSIVPDVRTIPLHRGRLPEDPLFPTNRQ